MLTVSDQPGEAPREVVVKTSADDTLMRYREWVERNRAWVHERSGGRCGYVHIPDMGLWGYAEFHRLYLVELDREGLVIDVRYNRGGHVSPLLLEKLARKRSAYSQSRWFGVEPWPEDSPAGCNGRDHESARGQRRRYLLARVQAPGSSGPLIGKRTWGGVIGIWPRHMLADGGMTTQPEFAFWFDDVGLGRRESRRRSGYRSRVPAA